jgi:glycogen debranching enzyme
MRDERDLRALADQFGSAAERERLAERSARRQKGLDLLWHEQDRSYYCRDLVTQQLIPVRSYAGFLPLWGGIHDRARAQQLADELGRWLALARYGAPTMAPDDAQFDQKRYWRGPVWAIINWMLGEGAADHGFDDLAERLRQDTRELIERSGFCEYYDPLTGDGLGGGIFSWTAAAGLAWALV